MCNIEGHLSAHCQSGSERGFRNIHGYNFAGTGQADHGNQQGSDGPRAGDQHPLTNQVASLINRMHADRQWFSTGGFAE
jgi:hypothetical protein